MSAEAEIDPSAVERLRTLGGPQLVERIIDLFLENTPKRIQAALEGGKRGDWYSVERAAHSIRSSSGNLGLRRFQEMARELEELAERRQPERADPLLRALEAAFCSLRTLLQEKRKSSGAADA